MQRLWPPEATDGKYHQLRKLLPRLFPLSSLHNHWWHFANQSTCPTYRLLEQKHDELQIQWKNNEYIFKESYLLAIAPCVWYILHDIIPPQRKNYTYQFLWAPLSQTPAFGSIEFYIDCCCNFTLLGRWNSILTSANTALF